MNEVPNKPAQRTVTLSVIAVLLVVISGLFLGCATKDRAGESGPAKPKVGSGIEEYRVLAAEAERAVLDALRWLDRLKAQRGSPSAKLLEGFSREIDDLQVESLRVRARAQAIQARGDAWFAAWLGNGESRDDVQAQVVGKQVPRMQESFTKIKLASQAAGDAFRQFFTGLRKLRVDLTANPSVIKSAETEQLIRTTQEEGVEVVQKLAVVREELRTLGAVVASARSDAKL